MSQFFSTIYGLYRNWYETFGISLFNTISTPIFLIESKPDNLFHPIEPIIFFFTSTSGFFIRYILSDDFFNL